MWRHGLMCCCSTQGAVRTLVPIAVGVQRRIACALLLLFAFRRWPGLLFLPGRRRPIVPQHLGARITEQRSDEHPVDRLRHGQRKGAVDEHLTLVSVCPDDDRNLIQYLVQVLQRLCHVDIFEHR